MNVTCDVVKDLLPLYVEDIASADTLMLVEEHIHACKNCKNELEKLRAPDHMPVDTNALPLRKLRSALRKQRLLTVLLSVMLTLTVAAIAMGYLTAPGYLPYSDDIIAVTEKADGTVYASFGSGVSGYDLYTYLSDDRSGVVCHITAWDSVWNRTVADNKPQDIVLNPDGEKIASVYYYLVDGSADILIYGVDRDSNGGVVTLPRLVLSYYAVFAFALSVICVGVSFVVRRNKKAKSVMTRVTLLPVAYLLAHLCIKGFASASYSAPRDFFAILLVTMPLYVVLLIAAKLFANRGRRQPGAR